MQAISESSIKIHPVSQSRVSEVDMDNLPFGRVFSDHMLIAHYSDGGWQDVQIIPYSKLELAPSVCALHYGQSIFEGMKALRAPDGTPIMFRPQENWLRMNRSSERICMPSIPESIFMDGLTQLIQLDRAWIPPADKGSLYIRPLYFATDEYVGIRPSDNYIFTIFTCPVGSYYNKPVSLLVSKEFVRAAQGGTGAAKVAGNYAGALYPDRIAKSQGYDNVLWLDAKHNTYVEECGTMNLFFVIDGTVVTSPLSGTILPGINRDSVIRLLKHYGHKVEIRPVSIYEIESAYEQGNLNGAFGAGTAATIAIIDRIGFGGRDMKLAYPEDDSIISWLGKTMNDIKTGVTAPPFEDWILRLG